MILNSNEEDIIMHFSRLIQVLFLCCIFSSASWANENENWGPDKAQHLIISTAIGTVTSQLTENPTDAFLLALTPGLLKEILDSQKPNNYFSKADLLADAVGAAIGVKLGGMIIVPKHDGVSIFFSF